VAEGRSISLNLSATRESNVRAGSQERVIALYETHRHKIYRFLVGHGLNAALAQDVTQDVFVDLFLALEKGTVMSSEQGWLYTVAGRAVADHWRREHRSIWVELDSNPALGANIPSRESTPEAQAGNQEQISRVAAGLERLPKEHRLCIDLRMQGLRYREIGKILDVSTSTVAEWLASAVHRLRGDAHD
jgi:RNA polymerase sigma-70 factor (ECF subfamily)